MLKSYPKCDAFLSYFPYNIKAETRSETLFFIRSQKSVCAIFFCDWDLLYTLPNTSNTIYVKNMHPHRAH